MKLLITGDYYVASPKDISIGRDVKELFSSCDYRIVNFEGPISDENYKCLPPKSGPRLMQPEGAVELLRELCVNYLTLANNHILDQGLDGYRKTSRTLKDFKLAGIGKWDEAYRLTVIEQNGVKIGVLNFCEMQFGMLSDEWTQGEESIGCAWINHEKANQLIVKSATQVDYLVAIVHAGLEMIDVPLPEWRNRYREMINLGCDAIIAHHPHVVQGFEIYNDKPICYSLGNFCFSGGVIPNTEEWNIGALAILEFGANSIELTLKGCQLKKGHLSLVEPDIWQRKMDQLCLYLDKDYYLERVNDSCKKMMRDYWQLFAMGGLFSPEALSFKNLARIPLHKYNYVHLLNNIQCESHRWCICRALKNE